MMKNNCQIDADFLQPYFFTHYIESIYNKQAIKRKVFKINQDGFSLIQLYQNRNLVAKKLIKDIRNNQYQFQPVKKKFKNIEGKIREIYQLCLMDKVVQGALYDFLANVLKDDLQSNVYSFQIEESNITAIKHFQHYVSKEQSQKNDVKTRGIYLFKADIESYSNSIPVDDNAILWSILFNLIQKHYANFNKESIVWRLLVNCIRVEIDYKNTLSHNIVGALVGTPICNLLVNYYLTEVDHYLSGIKQGFYIRYGDDILFAHKDFHLFNEAMTEYKKILEKLKLNVNESKETKCFFNGSGRNSNEDKLIKGITSIYYLGYRINFNGTLALNKKKVKKLLNTIKMFCNNQNLLLQGMSLDDKGQLLCAGINRIFKIQQNRCQDCWDKLLTVVTDRNQLRQLDYVIALMVAENLTKISGVKAFRKISYQRIRANWKLLSLTTLRNLKAA